MRQLVDKNVVKDLWTGVKIGHAKNELVGVLDIVSLLPVATFTFGFVYKQVKGDMKDKRLSNYSLKSSCNCRS